VRDHAAALSASTLRVFSLPNANLTVRRWPPDSRRTCTASCSERAGQARSSTRTSRPSRATVAARRPGVAGPCQVVGTGFLSSSMTGGRAGRAAETPTGESVSTDLGRRVGETFEAGSGHA